MGSASTRLQRGLGGVAGVIFAVTLGLTLTPAKAAGGEAQTFVDLANVARAGDGVAALDTAGDLDQVAANHAAAMAAQHKLFHNPALGQQVTNWSLVGENVGVGPDAQTIHQAFLDS